MDWQLFDGWMGVLRTVVVGTVAYAALVIVLRATGKRTLSKMNAFDLVVTIAIGSALSATMLSRSTPLVEGIAGLTLLVGLQYAMTWLSVRSERVERILKAEPSLLFHRGRFIRDAMRRERVSENELLAAARSSGRDSLGPDMSIVLEADGALSIVGQKSGSGGASSLADVAGTSKQGAGPR
jgi:uncharacterized membrane protein YcaP (DUF421 family)